MSDTQFEFERSRAYWRHVPSGKGKRDTTDLAQFDDRALCDAWDDGFRERFANYPEEEQFLRTLAPRLHGRRVLSVGSGLGFHELYYAAADAVVTCADIVDSNVDVVARVAAAKRLTSVSTRCLPTADGAALDGSFDVVVLYGCLMHMPPATQRALLASARRTLASNGSIVLMVYGWEFARRLCGWSSPAEFDPVRFATRSDPIVGDAACPWADWYDDEKILALAPGLRIVRKQAWNDAQYLWYELSEKTPAACVPFFATSALTSGRVVRRMPLRRFEAADAALQVSWRGLRVTTAASTGSYAAMARIDPPPSGANAVVASVDLQRGGCSLGLLDEGCGEFVATTSVATAGSHDLLLLAPRWPQRAQVVFSNYQPDSPEASGFVIRRVALIERVVAQPPRSYV